MEVFNVPRVSEITIISSSQVGKTEIVNNIVGYIIDRDPAPILVVLPTLEMAGAWSKDRLDPMVRDTPVLTGKLGELGKSKRSDETILRKSFAGGFIQVAGANSPASLSSRPVRVVLADEVDRFPHSAGKEGDPLSLAHKRTSNFHNRKHIDTSTPTIKGFSRIEGRFEASDMRRFFVPCGDCGELQVLKWSQVVFDKTGEIEDRAASALYACEHCGSAWTESEKREAVRRGEWRATNEKASGRHVGFHIWEIYSPWSSMRAIVRSFLQAKGDPETLQVFVNTVLGESWEESGETLDETALANRRERYLAQVPKRALVVTAGVDIQSDRIEAEAVAWTEEEESFGIEYRVFYGDTEGAPVWQQLEAWLDTRYEHESGATVGIAATCIDSGHRTDTVYALARKLSRRRVFAVKGRGGAGIPIVSAPQRKKIASASAAKRAAKQRGVDLFTIGTDEAKSTIYARLKINEPGPKYCHFPEDYPESFFEGLTAEKRVKEFYKGFPRYTWRKPPGKPNEPLDLRVYSLAALILLRPVWSSLSERIHSAPIAEPDSASPDEPETVKTPTKKRRKRRRSGFVGGFK